MEEFVELVLRLLVPVSGVLEHLDLLRHRIWDATRHEIAKVRIDLIRALL
jgi:hypothetical protein